VLLLSALTFAATTRQPIAEIHNSYGPENAVIAAQNGVVALANDAAPGVVTLYEIGTWNYLATLSTADPTVMVWQIVITPHYIAVAGWGNNQDMAIYIFTPTDGTWQDQTSSTVLSVPGVEFLTVAAWGNVIVSGGSNQLYLFIEPDGGWVTANPTATISAGNGVTELNDQVAIIGPVGSGGTTIAAPGVCGKTDCIAVYNAPQGGWSDTSTPTAILNPPQLPSNNEFGFSVQMGKGYIATVTDTTSQAVLLYAEPKGGWANMTGPTYILSTGGKYAPGVSLGITQSGSDVILCCTYSTSRSYFNKAYLWRAANNWGNEIILTVGTESNTLNAGAITADYAFTADDSGNIFVFNGK
jgi:hypothetical protein